jgi:Disulphide bond corrector protein DsbC
MKHVGWLIGLVGVVLPAVLIAQQIGLLDGAQGLDAASRRGVGHVSYVAEPQGVAAGKAGVLELRFKVDDGFHVNSHTPKSELLIPTEIRLQPAAGVKVGGVVYPAGTAYSFSFDPKEKLDVYTGEFVVKVPVVAAAGQHAVTGSLHYQACDHAACYPPRSLAVQAIFTAK